MSSERTRLHEAGHEVIATVLGCDPRGATVVGGEVWSGIARFSPVPVSTEVWDQGHAALSAGLPFACWPVEIRQAIETRVLIILAGEAAALLLGEPPEPRTARVAESTAERAAEIAAVLPEPTAADLEAFTAAVNDTTEDTDDVKIARMARVAHGDDLASGASWLAYLDAQVRALVLVHAEQIRLLAELLELEPTLSGEAVAAALSPRGPDGH